MKQAIIQDDETIHAYDLMAELSKSVKAMIGELDAEIFLTSNRQSDTGRPVIKVHFNGPQADAAYKLWHNFVNNNDRLSEACLESSHQPTEYPAVELDLEAVRKIHGNHLIEIREEAQHAGKIMAQLRANQKTEGRGK